MNNLTRTIIYQLKINIALIKTNHSFVTQLITLTEGISFALDHQKQIDIILLDFAKALDTMSCHKLKPCSNTQ